MEILDKIAMYEKKILAETDFIKTPNSYIFDMTEIEVEGEFTEYFKAIIYRNAQIILERLAKYKQRMKELEDLKPVQAPKSENNDSASLNDSDVPLLENRIDRRDLSKYISTLEHSLFEDETKMIISSLPKEEKVRLKLYFLKRMIELKKEIRVSVMLDPTKDISDLQNQIVQCELVIELINQVEQEVDKDKEEESEISRIILVPDLKNKNSYLYGDILRFIENRKEIKNVVDKLMDGYFLQTKDTKPIEMYKQQKLYEYKHPNGIRVLYIVNGGYIFICSMFYKDKQKSIRISGNYEEAINRYQASIEYMRDNMGQADFYIEQDEYLANINTVLNIGISYTKKVGE